MKRGLVMSGGGAKGAFTQGVQVGMLWCYVRDLVCEELGVEKEIGSSYADMFLGDLDKTILSDGRDLKDIIFAELGIYPDMPDYEFIAGVSVGALQAGRASQYEYGNLYNAVAAQDATWMDIKSSKEIYKSWCIGKLSGLLAKNAFYDSTPLWDMVRPQVNDDVAKKCNREVRFGCCSVATGEYVEVNQNTPDLWKWIIASSAFAPFFLPIKIDGDLWMDGGYRCVTPLKSAIKYGCDRIDVILTGPPGVGSMSTKDNKLGTKINALTIGMRCVDMMCDEIFIRDIEMALKYNDMIDAGVYLPGKRKLDIRVFMPEKKLGDSLDFSPDRNRERRKHGIEVAKRILTHG